MTLTEKWDACQRMARRALWPQHMLIEARRRMATGHRQYGGGAPDQCVREAYEEVVDTGNYAALGELATGGRWEWWLVCLLAGLSGRLLARLARRESE